MYRRKTEVNLPWDDIFKGKGVDIGSGDDPLQIPDCVHFDQEDGDANHILDYLEEGSFDFVHASHVLEHLHDPTQALKDWSKLLKPGGYIVGEVPSWELYEGKRERSVFNPDHKSTFSLWSKKGGTELQHFYALEFFPKVAALSGMDLVSLRLIDTNYNYCVGASIDQTFPFENAVECYIEFFLQKHAASTHNL